MNTNTNMGIDLSIDGGVYKPKTIGELADKLREGVSCIVVASNEEFTNICLDGWLDMRGQYKTRPSKIEGYVIYEPIEK